MTKRIRKRSQWITTLFGLLFFAGGPQTLMAEPTAAAVAAFQSYTRSVQQRLVQQHHTPNGFLVAAGGDRLNADRQLRAGELVVERLSPPPVENAGAMLHHWRGTAFSPGSKAADFERLMRSFRTYPQHFAPEVIDAKVIAESGDRLQAWMRVRQRHVITVVMDTSYNVEFGRLDTAHGYSISESTRIAEIDAAGTRSERILDPDEEHGFLWRLNTYWSYEERDGGLYLQMETVSLTRDIPKGLGWVVRPYVESVPKDSVEFTLHSAVQALQAKKEVAK